MDIDGLIQLDKELLLALNGSHSLFVDGLAHVLTTASTWIPLYLSLFYLVVKNNENVQQIMLVVAGAALCVVLAGTVDDMLVKPWVQRPRPTHDPEIGIWVDVVNGYRGGSYGFFSAHAANTFSIAVYFCCVVRSRLLGLSLVLWSLANCWTRVYLGVHYPGDILCGLLWGGMVGAGLAACYFHLRRRFFGPPRYISSQYTATGYQHSDADVVLCVLALTLAYALVRACLV